MHALMVFNDQLFFKQPLYIKNIYMWITEKIICELMIITVKYNFNVSDYTPEAGDEVTINKFKFNS